MSELKCEVSILTQDEVRQIHDASLNIIKEIGMRVEHERMLEALKEIGANVDFNKKIVKFPARLAEECMRKQVEKANRVVDGPELFADPLTLQTGKPVNKPMSLNPHIFCISISDTDTDDIRPATLKDLEDSVIVGNELNNLLEMAPIVVPTDVQSELNDAYMFATMLKRSNKRVSGELFNPKTIPYIKEMYIAALGSEEKFKKEQPIAYPCLLHGTLTISEYALDMAFKVLDLGMPVRFGVPMGIAGFSSPVTLAGALATANAEALGSFVMAEAVGGDSYGSLGGVINFNQANGTTLYASPEKQLMYFALRDIAKFYGFKYWKHYGGHANCSDACYPGIQAGIEKGFSSMFSVMTNSIYIHCGMLSPEAASIPQMVMDDEICEIVNRMNRGIEVNEEKISLDLIKKVGIHGNYINPEDDEVLDHMVRHFREENFLPKLSVRLRPQAWQESKQDMLKNAKALVKKILAEKDPHPLGEEKEKEIDRILKACVEKCS